jgi:FSR family fosmidomycin resistance protein-like MFS transporter
MSLLFDSLFSSVALGHLMVDVLNGQRAVLLAYLSGPLGLSNAVLGLVSTLYVFSGALTQPLFGHLTDRIGSRWVVAGGVLWISLFFTLAVMVSGHLALALLVVASLGSGAFHPAGTMQATLRGRDHLAGRETTAAAYFFVFGQLGLFFGPMLGGPLLEHYGPGGLIVLSVFGLPVGLNAAVHLRSTVIAESTELPAASSAAAQANPMFGESLYTFGAFGLMAAFQSWSQQTMVTFLPKYLSDLGQSPGAYGLLAAIFMGGSALGNVLGGNLADRFGKRRVAMLALALASVPLYLIGDVGWSLWLYLLIPVAGALTGATHSIIVVLAQRFLPNRMAFASGLILGFLFTSGALGTLLTGYLADLWGFPAVFHLNAAIALTAAVLALSLQKT